MPAEDKTTREPGPLPDNTVPSMRIGRYAVVRELGRGGMGIVYEATDPAIGRRVAIKVINLQFLTGAGEAQLLRERLFREARSAGTLSHSGIVVVYDVGEDREMAFIAMEYVDGPSLQQVLQSGRKLQVAEVSNVLRQIATALDYAHENGVVHRDIKPPNIMLHRGNQVKIADFGIAKITTAPKYTATGLVMGTPAYMSPEQIEGREVDGRSDQFSLAVVAYELLTGAGPFQSGTYASVVHSIVYGQRPSAHGANPLLPAGVDPVFARAMAANPAYRFANCTEFVSALDTALSAPSPVAAPTAAPVAAPVVAPVAAQAAPRTASDNARRLIILLAGFLVLAVAGAAGYRFWPALRDLAGRQPQEVRPSVGSPNAGSATGTPAPPITPVEKPNDTSKESKTAALATQADSHPPARTDAAPKTGAPVVTAQQSLPKKSTAPPANAESANQPPAAHPTEVARQPVVQAPPSTGVTVTVRADLAWTNTGIALQAGDTARIVAGGRIRVSADRRIGVQQPGGFYPNCGQARQQFRQPVGRVPAPLLPCWSLIGRVIPGGPIFEVGAQGTVPAGSAGRLWLGVNDDDFTDNDGAWTAVVTVEHH